MKLRTLAPRLPLVVLLALMAAYVLVFGSYTVLKHMQFGDSGFDLGIHDQGLWLLSRGYTPFNTVRGLHQFGDHNWFIMVLLTPLYWLWADVRLLLVFQSLACALGALPLYLMARERLGNSWLGLAFGAAYLLYPALGNVNLDHFHPEALATPLLLLSFYTGTRGSYTWFVPSIVLSLLCKENVSIVVALLGIYLAMAGRKTAGVLTAAAGICWFALCLKVFLPYFNGYGFFRDEGGYWFSGLRPGIMDPGFIYSRFVRVENAHYLFDLLAPVAFLPLLSPMVFGISLAPIAINIVSGVSYLRSINYHYTVNVTPFILAAAVLAADRLQRIRILRYLVPLLLIGTATAGNVWLSKLPFHAAVERIEARWKVITSSSRLDAINRALALIPDESGVSADPFLVPHLTHRRHIYEFPNPFMPVYWGIHGENPHEPTLVDYIFVKDRLSPLTLRLFDVLQEAEIFAPVLAQGDIRLLKRTAGSPSRAYGLKGRFYPITTARLPGREPKGNLLWEGLFPIIEFPATAGVFRSLTGTGPPLSDGFSALFSGFIWIEEPGEYLFRVSGDDGFRLWIDGTAVVEQTTFRPGHIDGRVSLEHGFSPLALEYFELAGRAGLVLSYRPPHRPMQVVPPRILFPQLPENHLAQPGRD